jgi:hypothetical protein
VRENNSWAAQHLNEPDLRIREIREGIFMNTFIQIAEDIFKYVKKQYGPSNKSLEVILAICGLITALIGIWVSAIYLDAQAAAAAKQLGYSEEAGATLFAMFICSPVAIFIGPIVGIIGGYLGNILGRRIHDETTWGYWVYKVTGAGITGLIAGAFPFALLQLLHVMGIKGF